MREINRKVFRNWLVGTYAEYAYNGLEEALQPENAKKCKKFSHEVLLFMEKHNIINPELK
jgi:hypothetical protein